MIRPNLLGLKARFIGSIIASIVASDVDFIGVIVASISLFLKIIFCAVISLSFYFPCASALRLDVTTFKVVQIQISVLLILYWLCFLVLRGILFLVLIGLVFHSLLSLCISFGR